MPRSLRAPCCRSLPPNWVNRPEWSGRRCWPGNPCRPPPRSATRRRIEDARGGSIEREVNREGDGCGDSDAVHLGGWESELADRLWRWGAEGLPRVADDVPPGDAAVRVDQQAQ